MERLHGVSENGNIVIRFWIRIEEYGLKDSALQCPELLFVETLHDSEISDSESGYRFTW